MPREIKDFGSMSENMFREDILSFIYTITLNEDISLKSKGILSLIFVYDGSVTIEEIEHLCTDGKASIRTGLQELEQRGYVTRHRPRTDDGKYLPSRYTVNLFTPEEVAKAKERYDACVEEHRDYYLNK